MRVLTLTIPVASAAHELLALAVEPSSDPDTAPLLLYLHGKGEAGSSPDELPKVCVHQTPPFQAVLGSLTATLVIAPQAPPLPSEDDWSWREYVKGLAEFVATQFPQRRVVATGFSRGGLGILQLISAHPSLVQKWAVIDPQPAKDDSETNAILRSPELDSRGWLRYGRWRNRNDAWRNFSTLLAAKLPNENRDVTELEHSEMALQAYSGSPLSTGARQKNLYDFLGLEFKPAPQAIAASAMRCLPRLIHMQHGG